MAAPSSSEPRAPVDAPLRVSVVLPCLNEEQTVGACVAAARDALARAGLVGEVLVADNGSRDRSCELAAAEGARIVAVPTLGYGAALRAGIAAARADIVVMGDADGTYDLAGLAPFVAAVEDGADLVVGNRFRGGIVDGAMPWLHRRIGNPLLTALARLFFALPIGDVYCGLRAFRRQAILDLELQSDGMEFALEMVIATAQRGLRIAELPTPLLHPADGRVSHLRPWRDGRRSLRLYLLCAPRWLFLYPGLLLGAIGAAALTGGAAGAFDRSAPLGEAAALLGGALALLVGVQAAAFAWFSRIGAERCGLLPPLGATRRVSRFRLEHAAALGGLFLLLGVVGLAAASRGSEDAASSHAAALRWVAPWATALALAAETLLLGCYAGVLKHTSAPVRTSPAAGR